ncbi:MAG TPA: hypothetical protein VFU43_28355 [Streptosporangiaceae bacterium]|nr:hypothetical protein [Streptosporangiaceae bacterium]
MASISQRLRAFLHSPQGRRVIERGRRELAKPENKRKAKRLLHRMRGNRTQGR